jgi:hypothetical protein
MVSTVVLICLQCHCEERSDPRVKPEGMRGNLDPVRHWIEIAASLRSSQ